MYCHYNNGSGGPSTFNVYYANRSWDETADWNNAMTGARWSSAGGDLGNSICQRQSVLQSKVWEKFDITAAVQNWVKGTTANKGVIIRNYGSPDGHNWYSANYSGATYHPRLVINYTGVGVKPYARAVATGRGASGTGLVSDLHGRRCVGFGEQAVPMVRVVGRGTRLQKP